MNRLVRLLAVLSLLLATVLLPACGRAPAAGASAAAPAAVPVRVARVTAGPSLAPIRVHGIVRPKDAARLSFKVGGVIAAIAAEPGQQVKQGDELARIELTEIGAQTEQSAQMASKAKRDLDRGEKLYADQVITLEQIQDLRTQHAMAQAALRGARFNQRYAVIEAPFDGVVLRKLAQERELVSAGQPVLALGREQGGHIVQASLSDREIVQTAIDDVVAVELDAFPGQRFSAHISEVASAADEKTGMFDVEARLDDAPANLKSGLVAKLEWAPAAGSGSTLAYVPFAAIVDGDGRKASVYVLADGKAQRREVEVAFIDRSRVALASGVEPGETVIAEGAQFVADGVSVSVRGEDETVDARRLAAGGA